MSDEKDKNWLEKIMQKHKIVEVSKTTTARILPGGEEEKVVVKESGMPKLAIRSQGGTGIGDDWLEKGVGKLFRYIKPHAEKGATAGAKMVKDKVNEARKNPPTKESFGASLSDPMTEIRTAFLYIALSMGGLFFLYGMSAFTAAPITKVLLVLGVAYVAFRFIAMRRLSVRKEFDASRCGDCLKNMKRIYQFKDTED